jgi:hypothetical protein
MRSSREIDLILIIGLAMFVIGGVLGINNPSPSFIGAVGSIMGLFAIALISGAVGYLIRMDIEKEE